MRSHAAPTLALLAGLALAPLASAHESIPADWCVQQGMKPLVIEKFDFDGRRLREETDKCGIIEAIKKADEWTYATGTMALYCAASAETVKEPLASLIADSKDPPVPYITGPDLYLSKAHHEQYRIADGISGACVVCVRESKR